MEDLLPKRGVIPLPPGSPWVLPLGRRWISLHRVSLTFSVVCLSLLPQLGAQYFPTYHHLSKDSGPSGRTKPKRGFRNCSMHTRTCIQVCKFLDMISEDGRCCLLRLESLSGGLASPHRSLRLPSPSSQPPLCALLFPITPLLFSPYWLALSFHQGALWPSVHLGRVSTDFIFLSKEPHGLCCNYSALLFIYFNH